MIFSLFCTFFFSQSYVDNTVNFNENQIPLKLSCKHFTLSEIERALKSSNLRKQWVFTEFQHFYFMIIPLSWLHPQLIFFIFPLTVGKGKINSYENHCPITVIINCSKAFAIALCKPIFYQVKNYISSALISHFQVEVITQIFSKRLINWTTKFK